MTTGSLATGSGGGLKLSRSLPASASAFVLLACVHLLFGGAMFILSVVVLAGMGLADDGVRGWAIIAAFCLLTVAPLTGGAALLWEGQRAWKLAACSFVLLVPGELAAVAYGAACLLWSGNDHAAVIVGTITEIVAGALLLLNLIILRHLFRQPRT
jgi:hypothetical protein